LLHALNQSLEAFFRSEVPLPAAEIDLSFKTPDREWSGKLTRPTVSLFLHEVRRSQNRSVTGTVTRQNNGVYSREMLSPFIRVRYAISVWTSEPDDEHRVLGELLSVVLTAGHIPPDYLADPLGQLGNNVELSIAGEDLQTTLNVWSALGVAPRASVELVAILPVAPPASRVVPAPPTSVGLGVADRDNPEASTSEVERTTTPEGHTVVRRGRHGARTMVQES
jgi:Pvc16 N-terminal domain